MSSIYITISAIYLISVIILIYVFFRPKDKDSEPNKLLWSFSLLFFFFTPLVLFILSGCNPDINFMGVGNVALQDLLWLSLFSLAVFTAFDRGSPILAEESSYFVPFILGWCIFIVILAGEAPYSNDYITFGNQIEYPEIPLLAGVRFEQNIWHFFEFIGNLLSGDLLLDAQIYHQNLYRFISIPVYFVIGQDLGADFSKVKRKSYKSKKKLILPIIIFVLQILDFFGISNNSFLSINIGMSNISFLFFAVTLYLFIQIISIMFEEVWTKENNTIYAIAGLLMLLGFCVLILIYLLLVEIEGSIPNSSLGYFSEVPKWLFWIIGLCGGYFLGVENVD